MTHTQPLQLHTDMRHVIRDFFQPVPARVKPGTQNLRGKQLYAWLQKEWDFLFNGDPCNRTAVVHHCSATCKCKGRADTVDRMSKVVVRLMLARRCPVPSEKEWTGVSQCLRWQCFALLSNSLLDAVFRVSIDSRQGGASSRDSGQQVSLALVPAHQVPNPLGPAGSTSASGDDLHQFFEGLDFHKLAGGRVNSILRDIMHQQGIFRLAALGFAVTAMETVSFWFERRSESSDATKLMDIVWPASSPYSEPSQFVSSVLAGEHGAASVLLSTSQAGTFEQMMALQPVDAHTARCIFVSAGAWLWIRGEHRLCVWPWLLSGCSCLKCLSCGTWGRSRSD